MSSALVEAAKSARVPISAVGQGLKRGHAEQILVAWCYVIGERRPKNPRAYLFGCLKSGKLPPDIRMAEAHRALQACVQPLDFGSALKTLPAEESLTSKKNRVLGDMRKDAGND